MPVVISEFEIVVKSPEPVEASQGESSGNGSAVPGLRPADFDQISQFHEERRLRVRAD